MPCVSAEDVRSPGGSGSVVGMVPQSSGAASHVLFVFFQCGSKRYRVSARESTQVSEPRPCFANREFLIRLRCSFITNVTRWGWGTRSLVRALSTVIRCSFAPVRWTRVSRVGGVASPGSCLGAKARFVASHLCLWGSSFSELVFRFFFSSLMGRSSCCFYSSKVASVWAELYVSRCVVSFRCVAHVPSSGWPCRFLCVPSLTSLVWLVLSCSCPFVRAT